MMTQTVHIDNMKALILEGDNHFPKVILDSAKGIFEISGKSVSEEADTYFSQVMKWLDIYAQKPNETTRFIFKMQYFNIVTSKRLLFILYKLHEMEVQGNSVSVEWHYLETDEDMLEVGQDFAYMVKIPFTFVPSPVGMEVIKTVSLN